LEKVLEDISSALVELTDPQKLQDLINLALSQNIPVSDIIEKGLRSGLQGVGRKYEEGEYFLSELLFAASILDQVMQTLKPRLSMQTQTKARILLGTVRGDIHDIGKNIFKLMAESAGFHVEDLGVDVDPERFVQELTRLKADILGLSCLLSTGLPEVNIVVDKINQAKIRDNLKVLIGGNAVSEKFARQIGVDAAALDAVQGVEFCRRVIKHET
jgi:5-methyltetrahydrofolate--homocysteine methyltransferase